MRKLKIVLFVSVIFFASCTSVYARIDDVHVVSKYHKIISLYTKHFGTKVSPRFVSAIVFVESRGKPRAVNRKSGAKGLMQIKQIALEQVRKAYPHEKFSGDLLNPDNNIKVGIAYLTYMQEEYDIRSHDALAVGFSSGPKKGERYSKKPRNNEYASLVRKVSKQLN